MSKKKRRNWAKLLYERINLAGLRLLFERGTTAEIRAAVEWEREHQ